MSATQFKSRRPFELTRVIRGFVGFFSILKRLSVEIPRSLSVDTSTTSLIVAVMHRIVGRT